MNRPRKNKPVKAKEATAHRYVLRSMDDLEPTIAVMQDLGFWAAYDIPRPGFSVVNASVRPVRRVLVEKGAATFVEKLRELHAQRKIVGQVCIATAAVERLLFDPEWEECVQAALDVITAAEKRGDEKALRRFRGLLRSTGNAPGPRTKRQTHRDMIEVIKRMHDAGESMKDISGADEKHKLSRALHTNLRRFCLEVYDEWMLWSLANPPDSPETYNELIEKHLVQSCDFDLPAEKSLAEFAFDRAKKHYHASSR